MIEHRAAGEPPAERRLRIGVISQYFLPEDVPVPASIPIELSQRGHLVRVVTGFPNYPRGKIFKGYRQRFGVTEFHDDIVLRRTPLWISHSRNPLGRLANYVSFGLSALSASRFLRNADVVYVYATQMTAAIAPLLWWRLRGVPYVLHVQDLWPESITSSGMVSGRVGRGISRTLGPWLGATYRSAAATISIAPTMTKTLVKRGVPADRAHTVYNWAPRAALRGLAPPRRHSAAGQTRLMYAGNLGAVQDLENVLRALALVRDLENLSLDFYGEGVAEKDIRRLAAELDLPNVRFHGRVSPEELADRSADVDFQLVTLKDLPVFRLTIPSKFQVSLAQGTPVITTVAGDLAALVEEHGVGFVARPGDPKDLAVALRKAAATPPEERRRLRHAASDLYESQMSIHAGVGAIERILLSVARRDARNERER